MLLTTTPIEAHCYSVWHYRTPQHCRAMAYVPAPGTKRASRGPETSRERIELPLPDITWIACPEGDERLIGLAKLRELGLGQ